MGIVVYTEGRGMGRPDGFDWDDGKAIINVLRHGVPFEGAAIVLSGEVRVAVDAKHSDEEEIRFRAVGVLEGRRYLVVYTMREGLFRIISCWRVSKNGRYP